MGRITFIVDILVVSKHIPTPWGRWLCSWYYWIIEQCLKMQGACVLCPVMITVSIKQYSNQIITTQITNCFHLLQSFLLNKSEPYDSTRVNKWYSLWFMLYWKYSAILPFPEIVHIQLKSQVMQSWYPPLPVFLREIWLKEEYFADCVLLHGQLSFHCSRYLFADVTISTQLGK